MRNHYFNLLLLLGILCGGNSSAQDRTLNPDSLIKIDQFIIELNATGGMETNFLKNYQIGDDLMHLEEIDGGRWIEFEINVDSLLDFKRYFTVPGDSEINGVRIIYGLNSKNIPECYFAPVIMKLDSITSNGAKENLNFSILSPQKFYIFKYSRWREVGEDDVTSSMQRYMSNVFKFDSSAGKFNKLKIVDSAYSDPYAVTFPWVEIDTLMKSNIITNIQSFTLVSHALNATSRSGNKAALTPDQHTKSTSKVKTNSTKAYSIRSLQKLSYNNLKKYALSLDSNLVATEIKFQWAAEKKEDIMKHVVHMIPVYGGTRSITPIGVLHNQAANFNNPCPHLCGNVIYEMK